MPSWAVKHAGAPEEVWLDIKSEEDSEIMQYDVIWVNKTPTRLPEVGGFRLPQRSCGVEAMVARAGDNWHTRHIAASTMER